MRAAVLNELGDPRFGEFEDPVAGEGQVVVDVAAAGLNPVDLLLAAGHVPSPGAPLPRVVGIEGAGRLDGRRVYFGATVAPFGSMAERALVPCGEAFPVPDDVADTTAVALGIAGLTAWLSLSWRARLAPGEHVLVLGASGAVGALAVQAARLLGAGRVVAAARSASALEALPSLGADAVVPLTGDPGELAGAFAEASAGRLDVIVDPLWGPAAVAALLVASAGARLIQLGGSAAQGLEFNPAMMRVKQTSLLGMSLATTPREVRAPTYARLTELAGAGELQVPVEAVPLEQVADAWRRQRDGTAGCKLVLVP